jgi:hypothetical protein
MERADITVVVTMILFSIVMGVWLYCMNEKSFEEKPKETIQKQWSTERRILRQQLCEYFEKASESEQFALYLKYYDTICFDTPITDTKLIKIDTYKFFERAIDNDLICQVIAQCEIRDKYHFIIQREVSHYELSQKGEEYVKSYPFVCSNLPDY